MNKKKKGLILSVLAILSLVLITAGVTYSFFNYAKQGTTENTVTTGTITFLYTEVSGVGKGISIKDAYPVSDGVGKAQTGEGKVFDFKVTSTTPTNASIPYEITARKKIVDNILDEEAVRIYLTKVSGTVEEEVLLDNFSNLDQTTKVSSDKYIEKTLHTDEVPADSSNYEQAYRLRMWIDDSVDFSPVKDENGQDTYPYNNKTFTVTVNVYANAKVVTEEESAQEENANIASISVNEKILTAIEGQDYNYAVSFPIGVTNANIAVETEDPNATVTIVKIVDDTTTSYNNISVIQRMATTKQFDLISGNNYFKITVISENKKIVKEYKLKVEVLDKLYLYKDGIDNELLTGGYTVYKQATGDLGVLFEKNYIYMYTNKKTNFGRRIYTNSKIDLSGYTKLHILYTAKREIDTVYNFINFGITSTNDSYDTTWDNSIKNYGIVTDEELVLDISEFNDLYYVSISAGSLNQVSIYRIWLS